MNSCPKCLVAVPTYGRPNFLPRILACFSRLEYPNKKLVIVNDDKDCRYFSEEKDVEIVNIDKHLPLSVKRNLFASWEFDIMLPLDDDDLFLPKRLINHVEAYQQKPDLDLYRNRKSVGCNAYELFLRKSPSSFTNSSFTRTGFFKSGGYTAFYQSNHDDQSLKKNFQEKCNIKIVADLKTCDFFYQFDGGRYHNTNNRHPIMDDNFKNRIGKQKISGDIELKPDYDTYDAIVAMSNEVLSNDNRIPIVLENHGANIKRI